MALADKFYTKIEIAEKKIKKMNFKQLAARNTSTPGFGKGDFVSYYNEIDI